MALSAILFINVLRGDIAIPEGHNPGEEIAKSDYKAFALVLSSLLAFLLLIERAGFIIAASLTFFGVTVAFGNKRHARSAIFGTLFITLVYLAFTRFLNVPLPAGIFKGLL
jgi:putative tricarboxylic transport membrane protein